MVALEVKLLVVVGEEQAAEPVAALEETHLLEEAEPVAVLGVTVQTVEEALVVTVEEVHQLVEMEQVAAAGTEQAYVGKGGGTGGEYPPQTSKKVLPPHLRVLFTTVPFPGRRRRAKNLQNREI